MQNTYEQIDASFRVIMSSGQNFVRLKAIKSSGEECHCPPQRTNIGDKFQTEILRMKNNGQTESQN